MTAPYSPAKATRLAGTSSRLIVLKMASLDEPAWNTAIMDPGLHRPKQVQALLIIWTRTVLPRIGFDLQAKITSLKWEAKLSLSWEREGRDAIHASPEDASYTSHSLAAQVPTAGGDVKMIKAGTLLPATGASGHHQAQT